jgi:hypothetical protein
MELVRLRDSSAQTRNVCHYLRKILWHWRLTEMLEMDWKIELLVL